MYKINKLSNWLFKNNLKKEALFLQKISSNDNPLPELFWEEDLDWIDDDPWKIASLAGIRILMNREFKAGFHVNGEIVAVLFEADYADGYTFDVAVKKEWRNKGLGTKLIDIGLDEYRERKEIAGATYKLELDVVSPAMKKLLIDKGLKIIVESGNHTLMSE
jgi:ribosomal protein S18 acetylase RimI-like enzyme